MIKYGEYITPEEYMELRKIVGWVEFPLEQAKACIEKAYMILCVRDEDKAIGVVRLLWEKNLFMRNLDLEYALTMKQVPEWISG